MICVEKEVRHEKMKKMKKTLATITVDLVVDVDTNDHIICEFFKQA